MSNENLIDEILRLKKERNAVILAHSYQRPEIQDLADFVGDSLALARKAQEAECDVIVTSGNSQRIIETAPTDRPILFVPDRNLGAWTSLKTGRVMTMWNGACHVHERFTRDQLLATKAKHPDALVVCHPECQEPIRLLADHICSTEKMIPYCRESECGKFIIVTETGILHRLRKLVPGKEFIPMDMGQCSCAECEYMKLNTLEKLRNCLRDMAPEVRVPEDLRLRAAAPLERMLELSL